MARLIYSTLCSLDLYVVDAAGDFSWAAPDEEVHAAVNELSAGVGTMLLGRRMYDVLAVWETLDTANEPAVIGEFAATWRDADKVVYSEGTPTLTTARTTLERSFDAAALRRRKATSDRDLSIGGPTLAAAALRAGLVDEIHLFLSPVIVGGGTRALPDGLRQDLELVAERRFANGTVHLAYAVRG